MRNIRLQPRVYRGSAPAPEVHTTFSGSPFDVLPHMQAEESGQFEAERSLRQWLPDRFCEVH